LRSEAPHFFWLVSSLLKDALILGVFNLLDRPKTKTGPKAQITIERFVSNLTDPDIKKKCTEKLKQIKGSACYCEVKIARNNLIAHPNRQILLRRDEISPTRDFPNLTISDLGDLLRQVTDLAGLALGKLPSEFWFHNWEGVSQLFDRLRTCKAGVAT